MLKDSLAASFMVSMRKQVWPHSETRPTLPRELHTLLLNDQPRDGTGNPAPKRCCHRGGKGRLCCSRTAVESPQWAPHRAR
jgi:hypothetical protein